MSVGGLMKSYSGSFNVAGQASSVPASAALAGCFVGSERI